MGAGREYFETLPALLAQRMECRGLQVLLAFATLHRLTLKSGYRESQPRWPKGSGDISGQWRDEGRRQEGSRLAGIEVNIPLPPEDPKTPPKGSRVRTPGSEGEGAVDLPPDNPLTLPSQAPATVKARNLIVKKVVKWIAMALARRAPLPIRIFIDAIRVVQWLDEHYPEIQSYFDPPRTLDDLKRLAVPGQKGYEIHHIVEKESAAKDGFPWSQINGRDNLVRVPKFKHHEINAWFQRRNQRFDELSPRDYLRGRSWDERYKVGIEELISRGVLLP